MVKKLGIFGMCLLGLMSVNVHAEPIDTKLHLEWAEDPKSAIVAKLYMLGIRDALYLLPLKNRVLCVNDAIVDQDLDEMLKGYITHMKGIRSADKKQWKITVRMPAPINISSYFTTVFPHPDCKL